MSRNRLITAYLESDVDLGAQIRFAFDPEGDFNEFSTKLSERFTAYCTAKNLSQFELKSIHYRVAGQCYFEIISESEFELFLLESTVSLGCLIVNRVVHKEEEKMAFDQVEEDEQINSQNRIVSSQSSIGKELYKQALKVPYSFDGGAESNFHLFKHDILRHKAVYNIPDQIFAQILFGGQVIKSDAFDVVKLNWDNLLELEDPAAKIDAVFDLLESHYGQSNLVTRYKQELYGLKQGGSTTRQYVTEFAKKLNRLRMEVDIRNKAAHKEAYKLPNSYELGELLISNAGRYAKNFVIEKAMDQRQTVVLPYDEIRELFQLKVEREEVFSNFSRMRMDQYESKGGKKLAERSISNIGASKETAKPNTAQSDRRGSSQSRRTFPFRGGSNYKRLPCKFFPNCRKGKYCTFIHDPSLAPTANESSQPEVELKTKMEAIYNVSKPSSAKETEVKSNEFEEDEEPENGRLDLFGQPLLKDVQNVKVTELKLPTGLDGDENLISRVLTESPIRTTKVDVYGSDQYLVGFLDEGAQVSLCSEAVYQKLARFQVKPTRSIVVNGFDGSGKMTLNKMLSVPVAVYDFNVQTGKSFKLKKSLVLWMHPTVKHAVLLGIDSQRILNIRSCDMNRLKEVLFKRYVKSDSFVVPNDEDVHDLFSRIEYRYDGKPGIYTFANGRVMEYQSTDYTSSRLNDLSKYSPLSWIRERTVSSLLSSPQVLPIASSAESGVFDACAIFVEYPKSFSFFGFVLSCFFKFIIDFCDDAYSHLFDYFACFRDSLSVYDSALILSQFYVLIFIFFLIAECLSGSLYLFSPVVVGLLSDCYLGCVSPVSISSVSSNVADGELRGVAGSDPLDLINYGDELTEDDVKAIKEALKPMAGVFKNRAWDVGKFQDVPPMKIQVKDEEQCSILPPFDLSKTDGEILRNEYTYWLDRKMCRWMTANDVVLHSSPAFPAHRVLGQREDGSKIIQSRVVVDFSQLNDNTIMFVHKNPSIEDIHAKISSYYRFNGTDIHKYFYHIPLDGASQKYCGISVPEGILIVNRVFQGLQNAPVYGHQLTAELYAQSDVITLQDDMAGGVELQYHSGGAPVSQFSEDRKYFKSDVCGQDGSNPQRYDAPLRDIQSVFIRKDEFVYDYGAEKAECDNLRRISHVAIGGLIPDLEKTKAVGIQRFIEMIRTAWTRGLKLNPKKTSCYVRKLDFTGFEVTSRGLIPLPRNKTKIFEFVYEKLKTKSDWLCFEGCCKFLNEYVLNLSVELAQLRELMVVKDEALKASRMSIKEKNKRHYLRHSPESKQLFKYIQDKIRSTPILHHPDLTASGGVFLVKCDASLYGFGASLWQSRGKSAVLIKLYSRAFSPTQRNYAATERECLGFYLTFKKFKRFLLVKPFLARGDCKALKALYNLNQIKTKNPKLLRWVIGLQEYVFEFQHVSGDSLDIAVEDFLSRLVIRKVSNDNVKPLIPGDLNQISLIEQSESSRNDGQYHLYPLNGLAAFIRSCNIQQFERLRKVYNINANPYMVSLVTNHRLVRQRLCQEEESKFSMERSYYDVRVQNFCDQINYFLLNIACDSFARRRQNIAIPKVCEKVYAELAARLKATKLSRYEAVYILAHYLYGYEFSNIYAVLSKLFDRFRGRLCPIFDIAPVLTRKKRKEICPECRVPVLSDDAHPQCDECEQWVHLNCIPAISKTVTFLLQTQPELIRFKCRRCTKNEYDLHITRAGEPTDIHVSEHYPRDSLEIAERGLGQEEESEWQRSVKYYLHSNNQTLIDIFAKQDDVIDVFRSCQKCEYPNLVHYLNTENLPAQRSEYEDEYVSDLDLLRLDENNLILYKDRILVPTRLRVAIWLHYHKLNGHQNSVEAMMRKFYWAGMERDVKVFLKQCPCKSAQLKQGYGVLGSAKHSQYSPYLVVRPNQLLFLDLYGPIQHGMHLLVIVDCFDNYLQINCLQTATALSVVKSVLFQWIYVFGFVEQMITDNGSNFVSKLNRLFYSMFDIVKKDIFGYSPWANLAEVYMKKINKEIKYDLLYETVKLLREGFVYRQLERISGDKINNIESFVKAVAFKHNNTPNYITGIAPNQFRISGPVYISVFDMYFKYYNVDRISTDKYVSKNVVDFKKYAELCTEQRRYLESMIRSKKYLSFLKKYYRNTSRAKESFVKGDYVLYYPRTVDFAKTKLPYKYGWTVLDVLPKGVNKIVIIKNVFNGQVVRTNEKHIVKFHRPLVDPERAMKND